MRILLAFVFAATSCNTPTAMTSTPPPLPHMTITSEGGIAGRGVGGITIDDPRVTATDMRRSCDGVLTSAEVSELRSLKIAASDAPAPGRPDQIRYTMKIGDVSASWYGEEPPAELAAAFGVLWRIRGRVLGGC